MKRLSSKLFTYDSKTRTFSAEVSQLKDNVSVVSDRQFVLVSAKTSKEMDFRLSKIDKDGSNEDTYGWHFKQTEYSKEVYPHLKDLTVLIIND